MKATVFVLVSVLVMGWSGLNGQYHPRYRARGRGGVSARSPKLDKFTFFDIELLQIVCSNPAETGNVMVSPASVKAVLAMLLEGASGSSAEQIQEALRLGESKEDTRHHLMTFLQPLQRHNGTSYSVEIANKLFMTKQLHVQSEYKNALKNYYGADVQLVDFYQQIATAKTINDWVNLGTHGHIPTLVDPMGLPSNSLMMFANALYFKGKWKESFDEEATTVRCFHTSDGQCRDANMMESLTDYNYANIEAFDAKAIELPYDGDKFSMLVLLPNKVNGIKQLVRDVVHGFQESVLQKMERTEVLVMMPRFSIEYSTDLIMPLRSLNIRDVFGSQANLSGIVEETTSQVYVSNMIHKTKIEVNEQGTTAAGSTGALVIPLIGSTMSKFTADRPFLFLIRDMSSGGYLFAGRVSLPDPVIPSVDDQSNLYLDILTSKAPPTSRRTSNPDSTDYNIDARSTILGVLGGSAMTRPQSQTIDRNWQQHQPENVESPWSQTQPIYDNMQSQQTYSVPAPQTYPLPQPSTTFTQNVHTSRQSTGTMRTFNQQKITFPTNNGSQ